MVFEDKKVLITGSKGGIGKALMESFAKEGAFIFANMREPDENALDFIDNLKEKYNADIIPIYFDITNHVEILSAIKNAVKEYGNIDVLVNNAGVAHGGLFQMTSVDSIRNVFDVNFFGTVDVTQVVLRFMSKNKKGGSVVNIASIAGIDLEIGNCAYGTSKAALIAFTKTLAKETALMGIRVNAVAPGLTDTSMAIKMEEKAGEKMIEASSMKRLGTPEEIANAVLFLASDKASFINGIVLRADGG